MKAQIYLAHTQWNTHSDTNNTHTWGMFGESKAVSSAAVPLKADALCGSMSLPRELGQGGRRGAPVPEHLLQKASSVQHITSGRIE